MCATTNTRKQLSSLELYVIVDEGLLAPSILDSVFEQVIRGGADAVQFRAKHLSKRNYYERARALLPTARQSSASFFVNDHLDIAMAISADGIHLGQNDLPCAAARTIAPATMLLGFSTHSVVEAVRAANDGAHYIAIGPVFATTTKENPEPVVGPETVRLVKDRIGPLPLIAIGGINERNVGEVIRSGADGVAVASAVIRADDPYSATKQLKEKIRQVRHDIIR